MIPLLQSVCSLLFAVRSTHRCAVLCGFESINFGSAWYDRAFSEAVGAIHFVGTELSQSVPVHAGSIVLKIVGNCNLNLISPVGLDSLISGKFYVLRIQMLHILVPGIGR